MFYQSQIFIISTVSCLHGERKKLPSCINVIVPPLWIWQAAGDVWPGKILIHVYLSNRPHSCPIHSPIPKVLTAKSLINIEILSLRGTKDRDFNCGKVSRRLPRALLSQCYPVYVNWMVCSRACLKKWQTTIILIISWV